MTTPDTEESEFDLRVKDNENTKKFYGMTTPDTEVEKDRVNRVKQINDYLRNVYGLEDDSTLNAGEVEELCEMIVDHCLTSRDTYWKERVRKETLKDIALWVDKHVGSSSKAIFHYMTTGVQPKPFDAPWDDSDRGRCVTLLQAVPEWIDRLHEIEALEITGTSNGEPVKPWNVQIPLIRKALDTLLDNLK